MTNGSGWLADYDAQFAKDPDYVAEGLAIRFAEGVLEIMEARGTTRADLAEMLGVSRAYVTRIFNAPPNLTLRSIAAVALALDLEPVVALQNPMISLQETTTSSIRVDAIGHDFFIQGTTAARWTTSSGDIPRWATVYGVADMPQDLTSDTRSEMPAANRHETRPPSKSKGESHLLRAA